jgi:hypothetical protein
LAPRRAKETSCLYNRGVTDHRSSARRRSTLLAALSDPGPVDLVAEEGGATDGDWTYTSFSGRVDGRDLEGVTRERHDSAGRLVHALLFLRPYASLRAAMNAMGERLADEPLPSRR